MDKARKEYKEFLEQQGVPKEEIEKQLAIYDLEKRQPYISKESSY